MNFIKKLLSEDGSISTMRLMSLISLIVGCTIGILGLLRGKDFTGVAAICSVFVVSAFGGKALQKGDEK